MLSLPHVSLLALCLLSPLSACAEDPQQCDGTMLNRLASQLGQTAWHQPDDEQPGTLVAATCKPWPDDSNQTVVALAYDKNGEGNQVDGRSLVMLLGKADTQSGKLTALYREDGEEDASWELNRRALRIDTARYHLAPGVRAFGVITYSSARGPNCPDFNYNNLLTLVVPDGKTLRPVLKVYLDQWMQITGNTCSSSEASQSESAQITLSMGKEISHGFADIILTAQVSGDEGQKRTVKKVLRYDGKRYPLEEYAIFWERPHTKS